MTFYNFSKIIIFTCVLVWKILLYLSLAFMSKIQHSFLFKVLSPTNFKSMENEHGQAPEYTVTLWSKSHWVNPVNFHHIWENFKIFLMLFPQDTTPNMSTYDFLHCLFSLPLPFVFLNFHSFKYSSPQKLAHSWFLIALP